MPEQSCENGGISIAMFIIVSAMLLIILSTIDFHTGLIWCASPRVNAEIRYIVTIVSVSIMFVYMYCKHMQVQSRVNIIQGLMGTSIPFASSANL